MEKISHEYEFNCNTMGLLTEIVDCGLPRSMGVLRVPINVFKNLLARVAQRATELDDPELNVLMLRLNLYEVDPHELPKVIEKQQKRIKHDTKKHP